MAHPDVHFELRVDTVNNDNSKVIIQGVSGVGSDIIGHCGGPNMRFREAVGILEPISDIANEMGFGLDKTFAVLAPDLSVNGEQYAFPLNVVAPQLWINKDVFEKKRSKDKLILHQLIKYTVGLIDKKIENVFAFVG